MPAAKSGPYPCCWNLWLQDTTDATQRWTPATQRWTPAIPSPWYLPPPQLTLTLRTTICWRHYERKVVFPNSVSGRVYVCWDDSARVGVTGILLGKEALPWKFFMEPSAWYWYEGLNKNVATPQVGIHAEQSAKPLICHVHCKAVLGASSGFFPLSLSSLSQPWIQTFASKPRGCRCDPHWGQRCHLAAHRPLPFCDTFFWIWKPWTLKKHWGEGCNMAWFFKEHLRKKTWCLPRLSLFPVDFLLHEFWEGCRHGTCKGRQRFSYTVFVGQSPVFEQHIDWASLKMLYTPNPKIWHFICTIQICIFE